jgi:tetratricopeptide (TPR) repeat protein
MGILVFKKRALAGAFQPEMPEVVMNVRMVIGSALALLLCPLVFSQTTPQDGATPKQEVLQRIAATEAAVRQAESAHQDSVVLSRSYAQLGLWYEDAGLWSRAETDVAHAVFLLRHVAEPGNDLAGAVSLLGSLHVVMGKLGEAEKEEREALKLRQNIGDRLLIARSWNDLAALSLAQSKYAKAKEFAQQATAEFSANGRAEAFDRISARYTLALALCYARECVSALPVVRTAVDEAEATMRPNDLPVGFGTFLLGYIYWKSGDSAKAGELMERGKAIMEERLGWEHPTYLGASRQYARFLRASSRVEDAEVVERQIRQAEAVVDVRALQTQKGAYGFADLK